MIKSRCPVFVLFLCLFSCTHYTKNAKELLDSAAMLVDACPDSALFLLDSIHYPNELSKSLYAEYVLLQTQAKDKTYKDIAKDTIIFQAKDYFRTKNDLEKTILATFYTGRVYQEQQEYQKAMQTYLTAETLVANCQDNNLKGLIHYFMGDLYYKEEVYLKAIDQFLLAGEYFNKAPENYKRVIIAYNHIGVSYFILSTLENHPLYKDEAVSYFDKALRLAEIHKDPDQKAIIRHNLGVVFLEIDEIQPAKEQLFQALQLNPGPDSQIKVYLALAKAYEKENRLDSALHYANQSFYLSEKENNKTTLLSIFRLLSRLEENSGHYQNSLDYHKQYAHYYDSIQTEKDHTNLLELQKKYDFELIQGINNRLTIQRQWIVLAIFLLVGGIFIILFIFYRKGQRNKEALDKAKHMVSQLKDMMNSADNSIHTFLAKQFDMVKKVSLMEGYLKEEDREKGKNILKKINKIVYEQDNFDWQVLYQTMNKLHRGYFDKIKEHFPYLSDMEYKICCLTKSGLNNTEIAIILQSNVNIIQMKKTAIRKKLGIHEHGGDIAGFMDSIIHESPEKPL